MKVILAVVGSGVSMLAIFMYAPEVVAPFFGSTMNCHVAFTSSEVKAVPSDHLTPGSSFHVTLVPSADTSPFAAEGISFARIGTSGVAPLIEIVASVSNMIADASSSFVPCAMWTLSTVGACHQSKWSVPPPPRFVRAVPRGFAPVLAVVVPAAADPAGADPAAVVPAGAAEAAGAVVAAAADGAVVPAAADGAVVAAAEAAGFVGAVVAAGAAVGLVLPPQAASTIGKINPSSANDVTRHHFSEPRFHTVPIVVTPLT